MRRVLSAAAVVATSGCLLANVGSQPDISGEAEAAAHRDTGCSLPHIKVLFDDYVPNTMGFADHHIQMNVCGQFKVYGEGPVRPHPYRDVTEELRNELCSSDRAGVPANADLYSGRAARGVLDSAASDSACPRDKVRILGHGWNVHVFSLIFDLNVCGRRRLYRKKAFGWSFYDATDEGIPLPCPEPMAL